MRRSLVVFGVDRILFVKEVPLQVLAVGGGHVKMGADRGSSMSSLEGNGVRSMHRHLMPPQVVLVDHLAAGTTHDSIPLSSRSLPILFLAG